MSDGSNARDLIFRGEPIPVIEAGSGPVLGYLHGPLGNPGVPPIIDRLASSARVIAPTLPGFFGTEARADLRTLHDWVNALSEIVDLTGLAGKPVVASSVTAMLALELAAIRPEAFSELVVVAPLGLWRNDEPVADLFARPAGREVKLLVSDPSSLDAIFSNEVLADAAATVARTVNRYIARTTCASLIWPIPEFGLAERLHRVSCPVTVIWGEEDKFIPASYAERFRAALPNAAGVHIIPGAGHLADLDQPGEVASIVEAALGKAKVAEVVA